MIKSSGNRLAVVISILSGILLLALVLSNSEECYAYGRGLRCVGLNLPEMILTFTFLSSPIWIYWSAKWIWGEGVWKRRLKRGRK